MKYFCASFVRCFACCSNSNRKLETETHTSIHTHTYAHMTIHLTHVCVYLSAPSLLIFYCFPIHVKHVNFELACEKQKQRHNRTVARIRFTIDNDPLDSRIFHSCCCYYYVGISLAKYQKSRALSRAYFCLLWHICISVGPLRNPSSPLPLPNQCYEE